MYKMRDFFAAETGSNADCCDGATFRNLDKVVGKIISLLQRIPEPVEKMNTRERQGSRAGAPA